MDPILTEDEARKALQSHTSQAVKILGFDEDLWSGANGLQLTETLCARFTAERVHGWVRLIAAREGNGLPCDLRVA